MTSGPITVPSPKAAALLRHKPFRLFFMARGMSSFAYQIAAVAVGWQVYALTHSAFDLGMVGLVQFLALAGLSFFGGHAADKYERRRVAQICQSAEGLVAVVLAWGSFAGWLSVPEIFAAVAVLGGARSFESPAVSALLPGVVPVGLLQKASALTTGVFQCAMISGPAVGGLLYALSPGVPYVVMAVCWLVSGALNGAITLERKVEAKAPPDFRAVFAGVGFVRRNPAILGTISLDLFAVLLGGATALLPIYAHDILHTGPWGLGVLRGAPAVGALLMTAFLARFPITRRVGMRMFQAVIIFGIATVAFALSRWLVFSLFALAVMGAADTISVIIRLSLVQLATPDDMRGRVGAVNYLFINASNLLGEFESGMTAALFGAVPAAALGGVGTVLVALLWMKLFPALREVERLE
ncbi:MFS transporter [Acidocella aquatica]|uniref:MFS transporter n=1 Tax=Acidocella aquatica TaxID=1922313 RepID=A0ABQ6A4T2_9PROT|nr:MFS transporter [Acidocella aquatica]GLR65557.1 MFS transporter [Acidocella aquatica]